jgi:hypothetical protein
MTKAIAKPRGSRKPNTINGEQMRRWRLGELRRLYRDRYKGDTLADDDAGREDLRELLLLASLAFNGDRNMRNVLSQAAPWMAREEAEQLIDDVKQTPIYLRKPSARILGDRLRLTSEERHRLAIVTIKPFDRTDEELAAERKKKDADRKWRKRRGAKMKPREAWLANCNSRLKPWEKAGVSRTTWYRRQAKVRTKVRQVSETGVSAVKFNTGEDRLVSVESQGRGKSRGRVAAGRDLNGEREQVERKTAQG